MKQAITIIGAALALSAQTAQAAELHYIPSFKGAPFSAAVEVECLAKR